MRGVDYSSIRQGASCQEDMRWMDLQRQKCRKREKQSLAECMHWSCRFRHPGPRQSAEAEEGEVCRRMSLGLQVLDGMRCRDSLVGVLRRSMRRWERERRAREQRWRRLE